MVPAQRVKENYKKIAKKFRKLKISIMASFQAKIGWKRLRKRKNKIYPSVSFLPDPELKIQKSSKKIQKIKKYDYGFI